IVPTGASTPIASITGGTATFRSSPAGIVGSASGTVTFHIPGVALATGTLSLQINTTGTPVNSGDIPGIPALPAGPYVVLTGTSVGLDIGRQRVSGTFTVTRSGIGASAHTEVSLTGGTINIGPGTLVLNNVAGSLDVDAVGVAGSFAATVQT